MFLVCLVRYLHWRHSAQIVAQPYVDVTSSSKQNIGLADNLENWRKALFINAVLHFAEYVISYILFSAFTSSDYSELIYRVPTCLR